MLPKHKRLTKKTFEQSFKVGKRFHSPTLQLIYSSTGTDFHGAAVVGKKVFKKAVDRNRLRRQLYGVVYRLNKQKKLSGTYILIAKPAAKELSSKELSVVVTGLVTKTNQ